MNISLVLVGTAAFLCGSIVMCLWAYSIRTSSKEIDESYIKRSLPE